MTQLLTLARRHVIGIALVFLAFAGTAYGVTNQLAGTASTKRISACASPGGAALHTTNAHGKCAAGERKLVWNAKGPRGQKGVAGAKGDPGAKGDAGAQGETGPQGPPVVTNITTREKDLPLTASAFTPLFSIVLPSSGTGIAAAGTVRYTVVATNSAPSTVVEHGTIQWAATANSITCNVQVTDKIGLGTVNSSCSPGFFSPGSHPGMSISDNITFGAPGTVVSHKVYYTAENNSPFDIRNE